MVQHPNEIVLDEKNVLPLVEYALSKSKGHLAAIHIQIRRQGFGKGQSMYATTVESDRDV